MSVPQVSNSPNVIQVEPSNFEVQLRRAEIMAQAPFLPDAFRGNPGAVLIAVELADRLDLPVMAVCQNVYLVHNKPAFSGAFYISCINASGRFSPVDYEEQRDGDRLTGVRVEVTRRGTGKKIFGPWVTLEMAQREGWMKNNPKWTTMPELMLRYRAASFFARTYCPDVVMGFSVEGEAEDVVAAEQAEAKIEPINPAPPAAAAPPKKKAEKKAPAAVPSDYRPPVQVRQYATELREAETKEDLKAVQTRIAYDNLLSPEDKNFLRPIAAAKGKEVS